MSVGQRVSTDHQLARLLQIAMVLEEVVEVRAARHYETLSPEERDEDVEELLDEAREESAAHRKQLESLIDQLDAEAVPLEEIEMLVEGHYAQTGPEDFDGVLYDQLHGEETAYKFYDDLIEAIEVSDTEFTLDREELLTTLKAIREEEAEGVEEVTQVMEARE
ncbi:ferritin-like domain-containing protein [Halorussus sp. MSC15.2]|uniref:ferritin-like domain-containing protein n=1 Tax=Halorussus sp. MSC15.2 TaxID=2283638 RepID=UPI0013CFAE74|nr:ferritin-like domain-containing protein [Halorussus sp. MSC15.2]NEU57345.1 ferritin-like domain-containing protein [Halorussus sp. MSC15.2]